MEFRVLGPLEVRAGDHVLAAGPAQQRLVLAALAMDAARPVTIETLIDRVWEKPPEGARRTLYVQITKIRRLLEQAGPPAVEILRRSGGYVLAVDPERVDALRFRHLVERARDQTSDEDERVRLLRQAIALWRGEPLAGLSGPWAERVREAWRQDYVAASVAWAHAELRVGDPGAVIGPLTDLTAEHPLVESITSVLMRALYAAGRPADALEHYRRMRQRLVDELGAEPGPELQAVHQAILRGGVEPTRTVARARAATSVGPAQLPADVYGFTGRVEHLARLDSLLDGAAAQAPTAIVISAVSGTAGVGKTSFAVHWAHRTADRFPDGQLYVNLRGFDHGGIAMSPSEALRGFLDALGVRPERIPTGLDARAALYRSVLAGRRIMVVLDNARDADQVRALLPGSPTCLVLVTSRNQLSSLVAAEGAHPLALDLLTLDEARQLLARRLGAHRVAAEPDAVKEIIARCARLPLALAIVAVRAATQPDLPLAVLAKDLSQARTAFVALSGEDPATDVRALFSWSYRALDAEPARLFRLLGLHPGPDIAGPAAASLAGIPVGHVLPLLAELTRANLLSERPPGRYTFHDLLRAYANELAHIHETEEARNAAVHRMLDHYVHTAHAAALLINPYRPPISLVPAQPGATTEHLVDQAHALEWFIVEHAVLVAALDRAADSGLHSHTSQLAWALTNFFHRRGHWHEFAATQRTALHAARRAGDRPGQSHAHRGLGAALVELGSFDGAHEHYQQALDIAQELEDGAGRASIHLSMGWMLSRQGEHGQALGHAERSLELFQRIDHRAGQARALNAVGWYSAMTGDYPRAAACCREALAMLRDLGDSFGEAAALDSLGYAHHQLGQHEQALACFEQALDLYRAVGERFGEAETLVHLGDTYHATARPDTAGDAWQRALHILEELGHADADELRVKMERAGIRVPGFDLLGP